MIRSILSSQQLKHIVIRSSRLFFNSIRPSRCSTDARMHYHHQKWNEFPSFRFEDAQLLDRKAESSGLRRCSTKPPTDEIDYEEFASLVKSGHIQVIDVREPSECQETGMVPGAINIRLGEVSKALRLTPLQFEDKYKTRIPDTDANDVVFICMGGVRSAGALAIAKRLGFENCRHYPGGWSGWNERQKSQK